MVFKYFLTRTQLYTDDKVLTSFIAVVLHDYSTKKDT